jgi:hypothetical protein
MSEQKHHTTQTQVDSRVAACAVSASSQLDFARYFLPDVVVPVKDLGFLNADEYLLLNQIRTHGFCMHMVVVERFVERLAADFSQPGPSESINAAHVDQFMHDQHQHVEVFIDVARQIRATYPVLEVAPQMPDESVRTLLSYHPLGLLLVASHVSGMVEKHSNAVAGSGICPMMGGIFERHWQDEKRHRPLLEAVLHAKRTSQSDVGCRAAWNDYQAICSLFDQITTRQVAVEREAYQRLSGHMLSRSERSAFDTRQRRAMSRWFIDAGASHSWMRSQLLAAAHELID